MRWCRSGVTHPRPQAAGNKRCQDSYGSMAPLCWIAMDADGHRWMRVRLWGNSGGIIRCLQAN